MPFKSEDQRRWMWANDPEMARRWENETKEAGGYVSAKDIHTAAEQAGMKWDNDPGFMRFSKTVTTESHIDKMNPTQRKKLKSAIENYRSGANVQSSVQNIMFDKGGHVHPHETTEQKQWQLKADRSSEKMRYLGDDTYEPKYSFPPFTVEADRKERDPFYRSEQISSMLTEGLIQPFSLAFTYPAHLTSQLKAKYEGKPTDFRSSAFRPMVKDEAGVYQAPLNKMYSEYMDPNAPLWQRFGMNMLTDPLSYVPVAAAVKGGKTGLQMIRNAAKELPVISEASGIYNLGKLGIQKTKQAGNWLGEHLNPYSSGKYNRLIQESHQNSLDAYKREEQLEKLRDQKTQLLLLQKNNQAQEIQVLINKQERELKGRYETGKAFKTEVPKREGDSGNVYKRAARDGNYTVDADGNIIRTDQSGTIYEDVGAVNIKDKEVIDFTTGKKVPINIKSPGKAGKSKLSLTTDSKGKKTLKTESLDTTSDIYVPNKELTQAYDNNVTFIQNQLPGFKPMGSSQYHKFGVTHVTDDIDGIMKAEDWHPMSKNFNTTGQAKYGPTIELTNPALDNKVVGKVDVNLIYTDAKTGNASGGLATELYRQLFPDDFYAANTKKIKEQLKLGENANVKLEINKTADELLAAYDPEIKSILDAMETSGHQSMTKSKHINRGDYIMEFGDPDKVLKAQYLYAKSIMGSSADLGKQFDPKLFNNYDNNIKILESIKRIEEPPIPGTRAGGPPLLKQPPGTPQPTVRTKYIPENIAKDPKKMQIALNDYYLNNSIYTRKVNQSSYRMSNYDDLLSSFAEWEGIGGRASGLGLNAVKLGDPGAYGSIVGNRQFKLYDDAIETPQEYIRSIKNQTAGDRLIKKGEKQILLDIANRNNFTPKQGELDKLDTFEDLLDLSMGSNTIKNTRNFLSDVGRELGMKTITRPDFQHGNTTYATLLGNFDNELDKLVISLNEHTPSLKSASERKSNLRYSRKQRRREATNIVKDEQTFQKLKGYLDGGLETSIERYKQSKKMSEALQKQKEILDAKIRERRFINIQKTHKETAGIEKTSKEREELYKLIQLAEGEAENYQKISNDFLKRKHKLIRTQKDLLLGAGILGSGVLGSELYDAAQEAQIERKEGWMNNLKEYEERDKEGELTEKEKKHFQNLKKSFSYRYPDGDVFPKTEYRYGGPIRNYEHGGPHEPEDKNWIGKANRSAPDGQTRYVGDDTYEQRYSLPPFTVEADRKPRDMSFTSGSMGDMALTGALAPLAAAAFYPSHAVSQVYAGLQGKPMDFNLQKSSDYKTVSSYMDPKTHWGTKLGVDMVTDPWSWIGFGAGVSAGKGLLKNAGTLAKQLPIISDVRGVRDLAVTGKNIIGKKAKELRWTPKQVQEADTPGSDAFMDKHTKHVNKFEESYVENIMKDPRYKERLEALAKEHNTPHKAHHDDYMNQYERKQLGLDKGDTKKLPGDDYLKLESLDDGQYADQPGVLGYAGTTDAGDAELYMRKWMEDMLNSPSGINDPAVPAWLKEDYARSGLPKPRSPEHQQIVLDPARHLAKDANLRASLEHEVGHHRETGLHGADKEGRTYETYEKSYDDFRTPIDEYTTTFGDDIMSRWNKLEKQGFDEDEIIAGMHGDDISKITLDDINSFRDQSLYYGKPTEINSFLSVNMRQAMVKEGFIDDAFSTVDEKVLTEWLDFINTADFDVFGLESGGKGAIDALFGGKFSVSKGKTIQTEPMIPDHKKFLNWFNKALPVGVGVTAGNKLLGREKTPGVKSKRYKRGSKYETGADVEKEDIIYTADSPVTGEVVGEATQTLKDKRKYATENMYPTKQQYADKDFSSLGSAKQYELVKDWEEGQHTYILDKIIERNPIGDRSKKEWLQSFAPNEQRYLAAANMGKWKSPMSGTDKEATYHPYSVKPDSPGYYDSSSYGENIWDTGWSAEGQPWYKQMPAGIMNVLETPINMATSAIDPNLGIGEAISGERGVMDRDPDTDFNMKMALDPWNLTGTGAGTKAIKAISGPLGKLLKGPVNKIYKGIQGIISKESPKPKDSASNIAKNIWVHRVLNNAGSIKQRVANRIDSILDKVYGPERGSVDIKNLSADTKENTSLLHRINIKKRRARTKALRDGNNFLENWFGSQSTINRFKDYTKRIGEGLTSTNDRVMYHLYPELHQALGLSYYPKKGMGERRSMSGSNLMVDFLTAEADRLMHIEKTLTEKGFTAKFWNNSEWLMDWLSGYQSPFRDGSRGGQALGVFKGTKQGATQLEDVAFVQKYLNLDQITKTAVHEGTHRATKGDFNWTTAMFNDAMDAVSYDSFIPFLGIRRSIGNLNNKIVEDAASNYGDINNTLRKKLSGLSKEKDIDFDNPPAGIGRALKNSEIGEIIEKTSKITSDFGGDGQSFKSAMYHLLAGDKKTIERLWKNHPATKEMKNFGESGSIERINRVLAITTQHTTDQLETLKYFADPTEMHARTMELRKILDIEPTYKFSETDIEALVSLLSKDEYKFAKAASIQLPFVQLLQNSLKHGKGKEIANFFNKALGGTGAYMGINALEQEAEGKSTKPKEYAQGGTVVGEEVEETTDTIVEGNEKVTETEEEVTIEEVKTPTKPLTDLTASDKKKYNIWSKTWEISQVDSIIDSEKYDIPGYFLSNDWKTPGTSYKDLKWER